MKIEIYNQETGEINQQKELYCRECGGDDLYLDRTLASGDLYSCGDCLSEVMLTISNELTYDIIG